MRPFQFKLQTALDLKLRQEDVLKGYLQNQQRLVEQCEATLVNTRNLMVEALNNIRPVPGDTVNVAGLLLFNHYWQRLKSLEFQHRRELERELHKLAEIRQQLLDVMKGRKVLEKLREKYLAEYQKELLREEQKLLDEMALNRFAFFTDIEE